MKNIIFVHSKFSGIIGIEKNEKNIKIIYEEPKNYQKNTGGVQLSK